LGLKPTKFEHDVQAKICISTTISIQLLPYTGATQPIPGCAVGFGLLQGARGATAAAPLRNPKLQEIARTRNVGIIIEKY